MRLVLVLICSPLLVVGQEAKKDAPTIPASRRADAYAVYSAVLARPSLSHADDNEKYVVVEVSGVPMEKDPEGCIIVPEAFRARFAELRADRGQQRERYHLERAFNITKPYDLVTEGQAKQFVTLRNTPTRTTAEMEVFRGAVDLITLGNVYFDRNHTLAAVYTWSHCGNLCAFWTWRVFVKTDKGIWDEQHWISCSTIANSQTPEPASVETYGQNGYSLFKEQAGY